MRWSERGITWVTCLPLRPHSQHFELEREMTSFLVARGMSAEEGQTAARGRLRGEREREWEWENLESEGEGLSEGMSSSSSAAIVGSAMVKMMGW